MLSRCFGIMVRKEGLYRCVDGETCDSAELKSRIEHAANDADLGIFVSVLRDRSKRHTYPEYSVGTAIKSELLAEMKTMAMPGLTKADERQNTRYSRRTYRCFR